MGQGAWPLCGSHGPSAPTHALSPLRHLTCLPFCVNPTPWEMRGCSHRSALSGPQRMDIPLENPKIPIYSCARKPMVALRPHWGLALPDPPLPRRWLQRGGEGEPSLTGSLSGPAGADYGQISEETWVYLNNLYGGGPEIALRQNVAQLQDPESLHGEQKIEAETRAV